MESKKVLVVVSSSDKLTLQKKQIKTGFFLCELIIPVQKLRAQGFAIVYANPLGNTPSMDSVSDTSLWWGFNKKKYLEAKRDLDAEMSAGLKTPRPLASITDEELNTFSGIFLPGGHAPMEDLGKDPNLGRIVMHFHSNSKTIAAICHGPVGLLTAKREGTEWAFKGYRLTCYSNREEMINELIFRSKLKEKLEDLIKKNGGLVSNKLPLMPNVVVDRELVTGQGPTSAWKLGSMFTAMMTKKTITGAPVQVSAAVTEPKNAEVLPQQTAPSVESMQSGQTTQQSNVAAQIPITV